MRVLILLQRSNPLSMREMESVEDALEGGGDGGLYSTI